MKKNFSLGFTLVELLIVMGIISVLTVLGVIGYSDARARSRDTKRITDLNNINGAINLYKEATGTYPDKPSSCPKSALEREDLYGSVSSNVKNRWVQSSPCLSDNFISGLVPTYISELPKDPGPVSNQDLAQNNRAYLYYINTAKSEYKLLIHWPEKCAKVEKNYWDPYRDGGSNSNKLDAEAGDECWAWSKYSSIVSAGW